MKEVDTYTQICLEYPAKIKVPECSLCPLALSKFHSVYGMTCTGTLFLPRIVLPAAALEMMSSICFLFLCQAAINKKLQTSVSK